MIWTQTQRDEIAREYARVGLRQGERWPPPAPDVTPDALLDILRRVADGAGRDGYLAALADRGH